MCYRTMHTSKKHKHVKSLYVYQIFIFIACFVFEKYKRYKKRTIEIGVQGF